MCLDHRSEVSAFYSQLDEPIRHSSIRLHFFASELGPEDLMRVDDDHYLGYIVMRSVGMPPIVRAMIRPPFESVDIRVRSIVAVSEELVNFYGQKLRLAAVPFMQQDTRYATCAHAAAWMIHYSAFRRGIAERRLISEIVASTSIGQAMRPVVADGLRVQEVLALLQLNGLSAAHHRLHPPTQLGFCEVRGSDLVSADLFLDAVKLYRRTEVHLAEASASGATDLAIEPRLDPMMRARHFVRELDAIHNEMQRSVSVEKSCKLITDAEDIRQIMPTLVDALTAEFVRPYIESGFPLYCHTENHATVLCGLLVGPEGHPEYIFHDDVFGPYLVTDSIARAHREDFDAQSATTVGSELTGVPGPERLRAISDRHSGTSRYVQSIVVPTPRRALLPPLAAVRAAGHFVDAVNRPYVQRLKEEGIDSSDQLSSRQETRTRAVLMMGVDFKRARRTELSEFAAAQLAYSSVHLAEWVVVVEYCDRRGMVTTEFVYDASSGDYEPRLQLLRVFGELRARPSGATFANWPIDEAGQGLPRPVDVPRHVGKVA